MTAKDLIHHKGYRNTTLADIASESGVPLGNVYYYFKTKDDIASAVIKARVDEFLEWVAECEGSSDPEKSLTCFLDLLIENSESVTNHGCPFGSLAQELCKAGGELAEQARQLLQAQVDWVAKQYKRWGKEGPDGLALQLVSTLQGISTLASTLNRPEIIAQQIKILKTSLKAL